MARSYRRAPTHRCMGCGSGDRERKADLRVTHRAYRRRVKEVLRQGEWDDMPEWREFRGFSGAYGAGFQRWQGIFKIIRYENRPGRQFFTVVPTADYLRRESDSLDGLLGNIRK